MKRVEILATLSDVTLQVIMDKDSNILQIEGVKYYGEVEEFEVVDVIEEIEAIKNHY